MVVLSAHILPQLRLSVDEYLQADLPEGQRYELVDGVIEVSPTPDELHDYAIMQLVERLFAYRQSHAGAFAHLSTRSSVLIPNKTTIREPDLSLYQVFQKSSQWSAWKKDCPFWIAEATSHEQEARDLEEKREDYWMAGIQEYWIVHRQQQRVLVLNRESNDWLEKVYFPNQEAISVRLPGFSLPVSGLFPA
jgi:Uma2 family endonuclease